MPKGTDRHLLTVVSTLCLRSDCSPRDLYLCGRCRRIRIGWSCGRCGIRIGHICLYFATTNAVSDQTLVSFFIQVIELFFRDPIMVFPTSTTSLVGLTSTPSPSVAPTTTGSATAISIATSVDLGLECFPTGLLLDSLVIGVVNRFNVGFI